MSRRARPSARTTRTAPTAPCVPVTRDGARVPRSVPRVAGPVTGERLLHERGRWSERSTGSAGRTPTTVRGRRTTRPRASRGVAIAVGVLLALVAVAVYGVTYDRLATTTTSSGRRPRSSRGTRPSATRSRPAADCSGMRASRTSCRSPPPTVSPARCCRSRRSRRSCCCRSSPSGVWRSTTQAIFIVLAGVDVALCWWAIGGCRSASSSASRRRSSSPSARSSGSPPRSRRPGTRLTSWRSA